ncbi:TPA: hypothetical protein ACHWKL_005101 [Providencia stuartii]|uniref:hypothetical protein n=1 Tax=Morganellaceae TaxID=1903414 RepID=UPI0012FF10B5
MDLWLVLLHWWHLRRWRGQYMGRLPSHFWCNDTLFCRNSLPARDLSPLGADDGQGLAAIECLPKRLCRLFEQPQHPVGGGTAFQPVYCFVDAQDP